MRKNLSRTIALGTLTLALLSVSGCGDAMQENICSKGEYPVAAIGSTGSACEKEGQEPSSGYIRYPEGKVPEKVGDKWDTYWQEHVLDEDGRESS